MKKNILILILSLFTSFSFACSCEYGGNFIKVAQYSDIIVKAKVIESSFRFTLGNKIAESKEESDGIVQIDSAPIPYIKIEVIDYIKGYESRKTLTLFGTDGADCYDGLDQFEINKQYIFAIHERKPDELMPTENGEKIYGMGGCSEMWIEYLPDTNEVYGLIKGKSHRRHKRKYSYKKLIVKLTS